MDAKLRRQLEIGFGLTLLALFLVFFVLGWTYPRRPSELPLLVDGIGIVLIGIHLVSVLRRPLQPAKKAGAAWNWRAVFISFGSMAAYLITTLFMGMVLSSAIIVFGCGMAFGGKSRGKMAAAAVLTVVGIYLLFNRALGITLYRGILFGG